MAGNVQLAVTQNTVSRARRHRREPSGLSWSSDQRSTFSRATVPSEEMLIPKCLNPQRKVTHVYRGEQYSTHHMTLFIQQTATKVKCKITSVNNKNRKHALGEMTQ